MLDQKKTQNKLAEIKEIKEVHNTAWFRRYSPQLDRVIEAKDLAEWNKIVEAELHSKGKSILDSNTN